MAKINRVNGNVQAFASAAPGSERTLFGKVTQSNDLTAQFTADFLRGWGVVGPSDQPALEDFNAAMYTHGQLIAYLHQAGVAEYHASQEYFAGGICSVAGELYRSLVNANIGNPPATSPAAWYPIASGRYLATQKFDVAGTFPLTFNPLTKKVRVRICAGGGAGGGAAASAAGSVSVGSGGGAGGYAEGVFDIAAIAGQSVVVGAGGAGALTAAGGAGGGSSIGSLLTATGGGGGITIGATSTFPFQINGAAGGSGVIGPILRTLGGTGLAATVMGAASAISGVGGMSLFAAGGPFRVSTGSGTTATNGGGGGGALVLGVTGTNYAGGNGGIGFAILEEYS